MGVSVFGGTPRNKWTLRRTWRRISRWLADCFCPRGLRPMKKSGRCSPMASRRTESLASWEKTANPSFGLPTGIALTFDPGCLPQGLGERLMFLSASPTISAVASPPICSLTASSDPLLLVSRWTSDLFPCRAPAQSERLNLWTIKNRRSWQSSLGAQPVRLTSGPDNKMNATLSADGKRPTFLRWTESCTVRVGWDREAAAWPCSNA